MHNANAKLFAVSVITANRIHLALRTSVFHLLAISISATLELQGISGSSHDLSYFRGEELSSVEGGAVCKTNATEGHVSVTLPQATPSVPVKASLVFHFAKKPGSQKKAP
jgi:hypothetical protein